MKRKLNYELIKELYLLNNSCEKIAKPKIVITKIFLIWFILNIYKNIDFLLLHKVQVEKRAAIIGNGVL